MAECGQATLVFTVLCCLSDVFIGNVPGSPSPPPPACDLRWTEAFWAIVQEGLASTDLLTRKRSLHLTRKVLASLSHDQSLSHQASEQGTFWWCAQQQPSLLTLWTDLLLVLETLEEKQVCVRVCVCVCVCVRWCLPRCT